MKKILLLILSMMALVFSLSSTSEEAKSDGEAMFEALGCSSCHGSGGNSTDEDVPSLAGREAEWIVQQLEQFQSGERQNEIMNAMAPMAEGFEDSISEYLSTEGLRE